MRQTLAHARNCYQRKMRPTAAITLGPNAYMHSAGGPDEVTNGLALCVIHHKLFDLGAMTVDRDMNVRVSERVVGDWGRKLNDEFHERPIALPRSTSMEPAPEYIHWHNEKIFKGFVR